MRKKLFIQIGKKSPGFTLLELTIVFTIIASIGALSFAAFSNFSSRQVLDQTAQDLKSGIDQTKFSATSRIKPAACTSSSALISYVILFCASGGVTACTNINNLYEIRPNCTPVPNPSPIALTKPRSSKITLTVTDCGGAPLPANNNSIIFSPQVGIVRKTGCKILITNTENNETKSVCVDAGGNAYIQNSPCI